MAYSTHEKLYGKRLDNRQVLTESLKPPAAAERLTHLTTMIKYSLRIVSRSYRAAQ